MSLVEKEVGVRIRRSDSFFIFPFSNSSSSSSFTFEDLMLEDEAMVKRGIQEKLVVRGQVVILECLEKDPNYVVRKSKFKETHLDAAVRWFHNEKEVSQKSFNLILILAQKPFQETRLKTFTKSLYSRTRLKFLLNRVALKVKYVLYSVLIQDTKICAVKAFSNFD